MSASSTGWRYQNEVGRTSKKTSFIRFPVEFSCKVGRQVTYRVLSLNLVLCTFLLMLCHPYADQPPQSGSTPPPFPSCSCSYLVFLGLHSFSCSFGYGLTIVQRSPGLNLSFPNRLWLHGLMAPNTFVVPEVPNCRPWFHNLKLIGCDQAILPCHLTPPLLPALFYMMGVRFWQI